ncbi:hypothetical protein OIY81_3219 [Cryptosporidium canis]|nr:hypothetical protein OIY81_3219 [Cryptosporidium canis]
MSDDNFDIEKLEFGKDRMRTYPSSSEEAHTLIKSVYDYSYKFGKIKNRASVMLIREALDETTKLHEFEIASLVNLLPRTPDEAKVRVTMTAGIEYALPGFTVAQGVQNEREFALE